MFERESMEQVRDRMIRWSRAVSPRLTDFRRGSVIRTIYEAVALVVEGAVNKVYTGIKSVVENNIYAVVGFDKLQARPSSGYVYFMREEPAPSPILIPMGTEVVAQANEVRAPLVFRTTADVVMATGYTEVQAPVVCAEAGAITNILAGDINDFVQKPTGIDSVENREDFTNGADEETPEAQKLRFQEFIDASTRGTLASIEYGAKQAYLVDESGDIEEEVIQAKAFEDLPDRPGEVDLYIWNGKGPASQAMKDEVQKILFGYTDEDGNKVYGYKNGGTIVHIYDALVQNTWLRVETALEEWLDRETAEDTIDREISGYYRSLRIGQAVKYSEILAIIQRIPGIADVRIALSTNGTNFSSDNIVVDENEIAVLAGITHLDLGGGA